MVARNILLGFVFLIIAFPVFVDEDISVQKTEFVYGENTTAVTDSDGLQLNLHLLIGFFYQLFLITICAGLFLFICRHLRDIQLNYCESCHMFEMINRTNEKATEVKKFYKETEDMFSKLEAKSTSLKYACDLRMEPDMHQIALLQAEVFQYKEEWQKQQKVFAKYGVDLGGSQHTHDSITAELSVASSYVGCQVRKLERDYAEDLLTLKDVQRDIKMLSAHFGK